MANILVLGGNEEAWHGIKRIKHEGHKVILFDGNPQAYSRKICDWFFKASIYDEEEVIATVKKIILENIKIDGVMTIATDCVKSVAKAADYLKLSSCSIKTSILATDKVFMKDAFKKDAIPIPWYRCVYSLKELKNLVEKSTKREYVLKPADSRGSRGVIRLNRNSDLNFAFKFSSDFSPSNKLILEEWLDGPQLSTESVIWNNQHALCAIADRNYSTLSSTYPHIVEDGGETPSVYSTKLKKEIDTLMFKCARAIGLRKGTIKGDLVITKNGLKVIEVAARLSGGDFSTITIPFVYGNDLIKTTVDICLNIKPDFNSFSLKPLKYQANRFLFLPPGKVKKVKYNLANYKLIKKQACYVEPNMIIKKITNHVERYGTVLCVADDPKEAKKQAESAIKTMRKGIIYW
jgi:biotin carboxylase